MGECYEDKCNYHSKNEPLCGVPFDEIENLKDALCMKERDENGQT